MYQIENLTKMSIENKKNHKAGGKGFLTSFWNVGILTSLVTSAIVSFIQMIFGMVMSNQTNNDSNENNQKSFFNKNNYGSNSATFIRLSKYPSDTKISVGV